MPNESSKTSPRVSVIIPAYNAAPFIREALDSVQAQTFKDFEILVVNDGSPDTEALELELDRHPARPRYLKQPNQGVSAARNTGIRAAAGDLVAFLDADDAWVPGGLRARWRVVESCPETQWIGADFRRLRQDGTCDTEGFFKSRSADHPRLRHAYESGAVLKLVKPVPEFLRMSLGWTSTVLAKKSLLLSVGGFEPALGNYEDHHLWIRLARHADFYFVPEVVTIYRDHPASVSRREGPPAYWYIVALRMLARDPHFRPYRGLIRQKLAFLFAQNMYYHRMRGEIGRAAAAGSAAVLRHPSKMDYWKSLLAVLVKRR